MTQNNADLLLAYCKINIGGDNEMGKGNLSTMLVNVWIGIK